MNQEKIGKYIAKKRKEKKLTQSDLAEKLNVSDRTVGNWENGRNMPDLSLFKPLCDELGITINELLSGEEIKKEKYQEKLEENIVNTIDYSTKRINKYSNTIGLILVIFGLFIAMSAIMIFPSESSWGGFYSVFGIMLFVIGISKLTNKMKINKRLLLILVIFLGTLGIMFFMDYLNVKNNNVAPRYRGDVTYLESVIIYETPFYDVIRCERDTKYETFNIVEKNIIKEENAYSYCHYAKIKRFKKILNEDLDKINAIRIAKQVDFVDSEHTYATTYQKGYYEVLKDITDEREIKEIISVLRRANYPESWNDIGYSYLFQLFFNDNEVLEFDMGEIYTFNDYIMISFAEKDKEILYSYIN